MKAIWQNTVLAESDKTILIEGNHYFPPDSIRPEYFVPNDQHTTCPWKGECNYYDIKIDDKINPGAAWYYPVPKTLAASIKNYVAFWQGVEIRDQ